MSDAIYPEEICGKVAVVPLSSVKFSGEVVVLLSPLVDDLVEACSSHVNSNSN